MWLTLGESHAPCSLPLFVDASNEDQTLFSSFFQISESSQFPYRPVGIEDDDPTGQQWDHSEDEVKWAIDGVYEAID
jgi:hypothetical protein